MIEADGSAELQVAQLHQNLVTAAMQLRGAAPAAAAAPLEQVQVASSALAGLFPRIQGRELPVTFAVGAAAAGGMGGGEASLLPATELVALPEAPHRRVARLTAEGREQVRLGRRKCTTADVPVVRGGVDADRRLIKSYESAVLVRVTEAANVWVNARYQHLLAALLGPAPPAGVGRWLVTRRLDLRPLASLPNLLFVVVLAGVLLLLARLLLATPTRPLPRRPPH
jgi:hypothetical protein